MNPHAALRTEIVQTCRNMLAAGLTRGTSGNVSGRVPGGMFITPSGVPYAELEPEFLLEIEFGDEDVLELSTEDDDGPRAPARVLRPSTEWRLHAAVLRARPEAGAVLHAHPPFTTALSCLRKTIPAFHYMVAVAGGDDIPCTTYATFGTADLAGLAATALTSRAACLLANHGLVTIGASPAGALALAIEVEALAEQYCHALQLGKPVLLSAGEMGRVRDAFRDSGYGEGVF